MTTAVRPCMGSSRFCFTARSTQRRARSRLRQGEHGGLSIDRTCDRDSLRLSSERRRPLSPTASRTQTGGARRRRGCLQISPPTGPDRVSLLSERDVSGNRVVEEVALLEHEADVAPRASIVDGPQIDTVQLDRALGGLEQSGDELDERRLPRPEQPTSATVDPGAMSRLIPVSTGGASEPPYLKPTSRSRSAPPRTAPRVALRDPRPARARPRSHRRGDR